ncbi:hypothetical protein ACHQM5_013849 [Ranunculus cassubicifolius]
MLLCKASPIFTNTSSLPTLSLIIKSSPSTISSMAADRTSKRRKIISANEARISLVLALATQASSVSQRLVMDLVNESAKYVFPKRFESSNLEEALMSAETSMLGNDGFDFNGSSQGFNVLAGYLFGKNTSSDKMEMTTPVITRKAQSEGEIMEMTTPVITKQSGDGDKWKMSFIMPSKYGGKLPLPNDPSVRIQEVPKKIIAVAAFSGYVTDEEVKRRESKLRDDMRGDAEFQVKQGALVEVAQYNPPFTLPFTRRNEIALEVERKQY